MRQLKYDVNFENIVDDIHIWSDNEIPDKVKEFINKLSDTKMIVDEKNNNYYCAKCFTELSDNYYCKKCHKTIGISKYDYNKSIIISDIDNCNYHDTDFYYYVFDIDKEKILLYEIIETIYLIIKPFSCSKNSVISVNRVFLVDKEGLTDLRTYNKFSYRDLKKEITTLENYDYDEDDGQMLDDGIPLMDFFMDNSGFLYTDNLKELKNTIYKYTYIWDSIKYFKTHTITFLDITYLPLFIPSFEYLIKYKLYNLAYQADQIEFKKSFKDTFGVEKKYLPFMVKNNIKYDELKMLSYTKMEDIYMLRRLSIFKQEFEEINDEYHIGIDKIVNYFLKERIRPFSRLREYRDYLKLCKKLGFNLKDKKVLFPKDLMKEHDKLFKQYEMIVKPMICNNIIKIGKILEINRYEDENFVIYPAPSIDSLIEESYNQNNCVKTYAEMYSKGETFIYFMRNKSDLKKSLVTIEVNNNKVVQARVKNNELPDDNLMNIIHNWEKKLIPIEFDNCGS